MTSTKHICRLPLISRGIALEPYTGMPGNSGWHSVQGNRTLWISMAQVHLVHGGPITHRRPDMGYPGMPNLLLSAPSEIGVVNPTGWSNPRQELPERNISHVAVVFN